MKLSDGERKQTIDGRENLAVHRAFWLDIQWARMKLQAWTKVVVSAIHFMTQTSAEASILAYHSPK
jgi:hypothetical protein